MQIEFVDAADTAARHALLRLIDAYNDWHTKLGEPDRKLAILLRDAAGVVQGGLIGVSYYRWLMLDILLVPAPMRGGGLGRRLMAAAEREALRRGCIGVWLVSYSFQAPGFYRRLGYREFGTLDFPNGHRSFLFQKREELGEGDPAAAFELTDAPTQREEAALEAAITAYNRPFAGERDYRQFGLVLRDPDGGAIVGGLWAKPEWGLLFVETLFLPDQLRGSGIGTRLMREAEVVARDRGYAGVFLDTFSFQARPFYERLGYSVFTLIEDYPPGHRRFLMAKRFTENADERMSLLRRS